MQKICLLLLLIASSCKGQTKTISTPTKVVKNVEIIIEHFNDTIKCNKLRSKNYYYKYTIIKHSNKKIENRINNYLLTGRTNSQNYKSILSKIKDSIVGTCLKNIDAPNETIDFLDHNNIVNYKKNNTLSVTHCWTMYNFVTESCENYNIDLLTGDIINIDSIVNKSEKEALLRIVKDKVELSLKEELLDYKENMSDEFEDFKDIIETYGRAFQTEDLDNFIIRTNNSKEGVEFMFAYGFPQVVRATEPTFELFFTFDQLKPYLTEDFKKRVSL